MNLLFYILIIGAFYFSSCGAADQWVKCEKDDANRDECFKKTINFILKNGINGFPQYNIKPLEPLNIARLQVNYHSPIITGSVLTKNSSSTGMSIAKVNQLKSNITDGSIHMELSAFLPKTNTVGKYGAKMTVVGFNIASKGTYNLTLINVDMKLKIDGVLIEKDGVKHIKIVKYSSQPKVGDMIIDATGLFPDKALNDQFLVIANENWRDLYDAMIPYALRAMEPEFIKLLNEFFLNVPVEDFMTGIL